MVAKATCHLPQIVPFQGADNLRYCYVMTTYTFIDVSDIRDQLIKFLFRVCSLETYIFYIPVERLSNL